MLYIIFKYKFVLYIIINIIYNDGSSNNYFYRFAFLLEMP